MENHLTSVVVRDPNELPGIIRAALKSKGMTQTQLASDLGISLKHLNQMLQGHARIRLSMLFEILGHLDVTVTIVPLPQVEG